MKDTDVQWMSVDEKSIIIEAVIVKLHDVNPMEGEIKKINKLLGEISKWSFRIKFLNTNFQLIEFIQSKHYESYRVKFERIDKKVSIEDMYGSIRMSEGVLKGFDDFLDWVDDFVFGVKPGLHLLPKFP